MTDRFLKSGPAVFAFLIALNLVAHYAHFRSFGLHDADYSFILQSLDNDWSGLIELVRDAFSTLSGGSLGHEGRPFGLLFEQGLTIIGANLGGLKGAHLLSGLITAASSFLLYAAFAQRNARLQGFIAAAIFTLLPSYALRQFLNAQFWIAPSLLMVLLALNCYLRGRHVLSYLLVAVSLLTYESTVFPFFAAPLFLDAKWDRRLIKRIFFHAVILSAMIVIVTVIRSVEGESRISAVGGFAYEAPWRAVVSIAYGVFTGIFYSFYHAVLYTYKHFSVVAAIAAFLFIPPITYIVYKASLLKKSDQVSDAKTATAGLSFMALSYAVGGVYPEFYGFITEPAATMDGLGSRVHLAGMFGAAIFLSSIFMLLVRRANGLSSKFTTSAFLAFLLAMLVGYAYIKQVEYKTDWQCQRCFWATVFQKAPDISDGTVIIVEVDGLPNIGAYSKFGLPMALSRIYEFPAEWKTHPRLAVKSADWTSRDVRAGEEGIELYLFRPNAFIVVEPEWIALPQDNVILFKAVGNDLVRFDGAFTAPAGEVRLKQKPSALSQPPRWPKRFLYDYVVGDKCSFTELAGVKPPRKLDAQPAFVRKIGFDGTNYINMPSFDRTDVRRYAIEFWIRPDKNVYSGGMYDKTYPPMPAMIGPMRLDQVSEGALTLMLASLDKHGKGASHTVSDILVDDNESEWMHFELDVDNDKREALFFVNGRLEKKFIEVEVPLKGPFKLGRGHLDRYWRGEIADVRISSAVRHTFDFKPESAPVLRDERTFYLMDGL